MTTELRLEVKSHELAAELAALQRRLANPRQLMSGISAELLSLTEEAFQKEGDEEKWIPLAASTIKRRTKNGHWPGQILQISEKSGLAASITPFSSNSEAGLSSNKKYAAIHQFGGKAGSGRKITIPERRYMPILKQGADLELTKKASDSILGLMRDLVDGKLG